MEASEKRKNTQRILYKEVFEIGLKVRDEAEGFMVCVLKICEAIY